MNQIQVTCDKECIYRNDGFCECDQHLLDIAEEFLRLKRGEEVEHLKERESIGAASMEDCSKYEWDFLHESIWINPWKVLSKEECDPKLGRKIIKLFHRENGYVCFELMRNRNNEIEAEDVLLNRALCNADKNASKYPKWTEFPEEVLQCISDEPFVMHVLDNDEISAIDLMKMKDLLKKYPILKDVFSLNEEDRSLEIYSEAMCKIRWDMHPIYGQDDCVKDQKRDLIEKFIVDGIENAISYYNTYIYDGCNGYHFAKDYPQFTKYGLVYGCSENTKLEKQKRISKNCDATKATEEKGEAKNSTLGTKVVTDEAHYFYPFVINPASYDDYVALGVTEGYTEEDYKKFKETALVSATAFATNAKEGCENEFALFVETDSDLYLPNLTSYLTFEKGEEKDVITISAANILDEVKDQIKSIEVYYNPHTTEIVSDIENTKYYHIITRKEV